MFKEEYEFVELAIEKSQRLFGFICGFYNGSVTLMEILVTFIMPGRNLMVPAWIPFIDWQHDYISYAFVNIFQFLGVFYQVILGAAVDTEPAGNMILLTGHMKALRLRVAKIGWNYTKSKDENYEELLDCISYHMMLLE